MFGPKEFFVFPPRVLRCCANEVASGPALLQESCSSADWPSDYIRISIGISSRDIALNAAGGIPNLTGG